MNNDLLLRLLEEMQADTVDESMDLNTVLRKCKVLARELAITQLEQWSTWEALGYPENEPVPDYRKWPLRLIADLNSPFGKRKTVVLPLDALPPVAQRTFSAYECRQGLPHIQESFRQAADGTVSFEARDLPPLLGGMGRGYTCESVRAEVNATSLAETMAAVRDRILNVTMTVLQQVRMAAAAENAAAAESAAAMSSTQTWGTPRREAARQPLRLAASNRVHPADAELEQAWSRVR